MPKRCFFWRIAILGLLLPLVAACGSLSSANPGSTSAAANSALSPSGTPYVLAGSSAQDASSPALHIMSLQSGSATTGVTLPNGLSSTDHQRLYTAIPAQGRTTITVFKTSDASVLRAFSIPGSYATAGTMFDRAVLSFDGHWLALRALASRTSSTTIALVDTQQGRLVKTIQLKGDFDLDAVSPDASRIYLLERLHDGTSHYYVRLYQVTQNQLLDGPIVDKTEINDPQMTGTALVRQVAADGSKVFTLYIDPYHNIAFIHILPLVGAYLGARCIILQTGKDASLLHYYTLSLHTNADGSAVLYAANGALGVVTAVNVTPSDQVFNLQIDAGAHFTPSQASVNATTKARQLYNGAALSPDGQTLFFAGLQGIWSLHTADLANQQPTFKTYLANQAFTSLGLSKDGTTLYAISSAHGIVALNASTGQTMRTLQAPGASPWGVEWIAE